MLDYSILSYPLWCTEQNAWLQHPVVSIVVFSILLSSIVVYSIMLSSIVVYRAKCLITASCRPLWCTEQNAWLQHPVVIHSGEQSKMLNYSILSSIVVYRAKCLITASCCHPFWWTEQNAWLQHPVFIHSGVQSKTLDYSILSSILVYRAKCLIWNWRCTASLWGVCITCFLCCPLSSHLMLSAHWFGWMKVRCQAGSQVSHVGLARIVYIQGIWPYIWWIPCQKYCITPNIYGSGQPYSHSVMQGWWTSVAVALSHSFLVNFAAYRQLCRLTPSLSTSPPHYVPCTIALHLSYFTFDNLGSASSASLPVKLVTLTHTISFTILALAVVKRVWDQNT